MWDLVLQTAPSVLLITLVEILASYIGQPTCTIAILGEAKTVCTQKVTQVKGEGKGAIRVTYV